MRASVQSSLITGVSTDPPASPPVRSGSARWRTTAAVVFLLGLAARVTPVLHGAGFTSNLNYDPGVYFAAADGFVHGRLPYRDFVLLHPPGVMLALTPFAFATKFVSDQTAFVGANLAFTITGALNAVLVVAIGRRLGLGLAGSVAGGLFAALWLGSVHAEDMVRLEPLANLFVLLALLAYAEARRRPSRRWLFAMGAALGAATSVKIWYVVPLLVLLAWVITRVRARRAVVATLGGAATAMVAINVFFFWRSPGAMWHMVVLDQLSRSRFSASPITRFAQANDLATWNRLLGPGPAMLAIAVLLVGSTLLLLSAWTQPAGRALVALVVAQMVVVAISPSWFAFYADYLTPALALALAVGVDGVRHAGWASVGARRRALTSVRVGAAVSALTVLAVPLCWQRVGTAFPGARLRNAVTAARCVTSDSPIALIELDALSRSFAAGCRDWVDVVGRTYGADRENATRSHNLLWQRDVASYLLSGDAFIAIGRSTGLSESTRAELARHAVIARVGGVVIYRGISAGG
jgi:alpha-1,2-mannosyltransferase